MSEGVFGTNEEELAVVDADIADLTAGIDELRRQVGNPAEAAEDPADRAALIEQLSTQESLLEDLEARREALRAAPFR